MEKERNKEKIGENLLMKCYKEELSVPFMNYLHLIATLGQNQSTSSEWSF